MRGPWTDQKLDLTDCIARWQIRVEARDLDVEAGMRDAISENNDRAIRFLDPRGTFAYTHDLFKLALFSDAGMEIMKRIMFYHIQVKGIIAWQDPMLQAWAQEKVSKEHKTEDAWMLKMILSKGRSIWNYHGL